MKWYPVHAIPTSKHLAFHFADKSNKKLKFIQDKYSDLINYCLAGHQRDKSPDYDVCNELTLLY